MSRVLLTGGAGPLSRAIARSLRSAGHDALLIGPSDLDVTDAVAMRSATVRLAPQVVIDISLPSDVEGIAAAARSVSAAAAVVDAYVIHLSTAEVFDGTDGPYDEAAPPAPSTPLGEAGLAAERAVADGTLNHAIVRTSWLYGAGSESWLLAPLQAPGGRVAGDVTEAGSPTYIPHLAEALVALARRPAHGVFHRAGSGSCSQLEFLRVAMRATGSPERPVVDDPGLRSPAVDRSLVSVRDEIPILPDWQLGLQAHLADRGAPDLPAPGPAASPPPR